MFKRKPQADMDAANRGLELERRQWNDEIGSKCEHEFVLADFMLGTFGTSSYFVCSKCGGYKVLLGMQLDD